MYVYKIAGIALLTLLLSTSFCFAFMDYNTGLPLEEPEVSQPAALNETAVQPDTPPASKLPPSAPAAAANAAAATRQVPAEQPVVSPEPKPVPQLIRETPQPADNRLSTPEQPATFTYQVLQPSKPAVSQEYSGTIMPVSSASTAPAASHSPGLDNMSTYGLIGYGSGFFITPDIIATNWHVVRDFDQVEVLHLGTPVKATVIAKDETNDLALLQIHNAMISRKVNPLPIIDIRKVNAGERVYAVGFPDPTRLGFRPKITDGLINSVAGEHDNPNCFQVSTAIQPGNSGGPLLNSHGQVVGILSKRWTTKRYQNVAYAVKSSHLVNLLLTLPEGIIIPEEPVFTNPVDGADIMLLARDAVVTIVRHSND